MAPRNVTIAVGVAVRTVAEVAAADSLRLPWAEEAEEACLVVVVVVHTLPCLVSVESQRYIVNGAAVSNYQEREAVAAALDCLECIVGGVPIGFEAS